MKIGIYAGTFDPVHDGHIEFAKTAIDEAVLEKVILVAEKEPYRKKPHASWDHRQAMLERATETIEAVDHDYAFAAELSHQHTMKNMLEVAIKHYGSENEFYFLVGSDIFEHIHKWEDMLQSHEYGGFVVALRDEHTQQWLQQRIDYAEESGQKLNIILLDNKKPRISSGHIREQISEKTSPEDIPQSVKDYIYTHHLYAAL